MGLATELAHPSPVTHWNMVKKLRDKFPKNSGAASRKRPTPRIEYTRVAIIRTKKTLSTGTIEDHIAATIIRSATSRFTRRITRSARNILITLTVGPASLPMLPIETITTKTSSQFHFSCTKSQNQWATILMKSSTVKIPGARASFASV